MTERGRTGVTDHLAVPVSAAAHALGSAHALVALVEDGDFECPFCARSYPAVKALRHRFGERLRFAFRHFPRPEHPHARQAAEAAERARREIRRVRRQVHRLRDASA
jgi:protein-disulfide isomerase